MALNSKYIADSTLQHLFRDKDTGLPLRFGYILFYKDNERQVGKPVYRLVGSPPNYSYIEYGYMTNDGAWRVDLNSQGYLDYALYYYPYDENGNLELYFAQCYSSDTSIINPTSVLQFSREAWPPDAEGGDMPTGTVIDVNYVPNGQFLLHTNLPKTIAYEAGEIRAPITQIAYGGWTFERPVSTTSKDFVTFERIGSFTENPESNPRYAIRVRCESPNPGDLFKDIRLKFDDVNKFNSADTTKQFTFGFQGISNSGGNINVSFILYKNFGTGGSSPTETVIANFSIGSSYTNFFKSFSFGDNLSKSIGLLDDDYQQLIIRLPGDSISDLSFDCFLLSDGSINNPIFPDTPNNQFKYRSLAGFLPVPAYDASDLYLTPRLTPTGMEFDRSEIGNIYARTCLDVPVGYLVPDGSGYITRNYSSDGIPYKRLQEKYFDPVKGIPLYGTASNFVTTYYINGNTVNSSLKVQNNEIGVPTNYSDGANPTGFTFTNITIGTTTLTQQLGLYYGNSKFYIWGKLIGPISNYPGINANTSGFTVEQLRPARFISGSTNTKALYSVTTVAASAITGGAYFTVYNTSGFYVVWYKKDGVGSAPSVPGALFYIEIDISSTWNSDEIAKVTATAISGSKITNVVTVAASSIPQSSYFNMNTLLQEFYVWYNKDGGGTDPLVSGKIGIEVKISGSNTATEIAQVTLLTLNSYSFAVPDLRGMILKGVDNSGTIDTDNVLRWSFYNQLVSGDQSNFIGSYQFDEITQHSHFFEFNFNEEGFSVSASPPAAIFQGGSAAVVAEGGSESRPLNINVNYLIKY